MYHILKCFLISKPLCRNKTVVFILSSSIFLQFPSAVIPRMMKSDSFYNEFGKEEPPRQIHVQPIRSTPITLENQQEQIRQTDNNSLSRVKNILNGLIKSNQHNYSERVKEYGELIKIILPKEKNVKIPKIPIKQNPIHILPYDDIVKESFSKEKNLLHTERNRTFMYKFGTNLQTIESTDDPQQSFRSSFITFFDHDKFVTKRFTVPYAYIKEPDKKNDVYWEDYDTYYYLRDFLPLSKYRYFRENPDTIPKIYKSEITADYAYIGNKNTGKVFQEKGIHTIKGSLYLGFNTGSKGLFLLSDGYFYADQIVLGFNGQGSIFQLSGSITVERVLYLGLTPYSESLFTLTGGFIKSDALIGVVGTGKFNHAYGVFNSNWISVGFSEGNGIYKMCNGELNSYMLSIGHGANIWLGEKHEFTGWKSGKGLFDHSGGLTNIDTLSIGIWHSQGTYHLKNDAQINSYFVYIGNHNGRGEFIHDSGTHKSYSITIGHSGGIGIYEINSGKLQTDTIVVGHFTTSSKKIVNGYFIQNNGKIENENEEGILWLTIGHRSGHGKYIMNNGRLHTKTTHVGFDGTGLFTHKGGDNFSEYLDLGLENGDGTYVLSGGNLRSYSQYIGNNGKGLFTHIKGTNFTDNLYIGCTENGEGEYQFTEGELICQDIDIGYENGNGLLNIRSPNAKIIIKNGTFIFERNARFQAVKDASVILRNSSFISTSSSKAICNGTKNLNLLFDSGKNKIELYKEPGTANNFLINSIEIKNSGTNLKLHKLYKLAIKVKTLILNKDTSIDLNGYTIYYEKLINNGGKINLNGGEMISATY